MLQGCGDECDAHVERSERRRGLHVLRFLHDARAEAGLLAEMDDLVGDARRGLPAVEDEALRGQVLEPERRLGSQRVLPAQGDDQRFLED